MSSFHEANTRFPGILAPGENLLIFDPVLGEHIIVSARSWEQSNQTT